MHNTTAATTLSFLLALGGGGVALANSNPSAKASPAAGTPAAQTHAAPGSDQQGTQANRPAPQANGQAPVGFAEEEITSAPFTVQSIDKTNRNLVLRAPDGTQSTVNIPSGTPGFDSLKQGDRVQLDYFAAAVFGPGNQQAHRANQNGSAEGSASNQAGAGSTNRIGQVRNIRKVNNDSNTATAPNTQGTNSQRSGSDQGPR